LRQQLKIGRRRHADGGGLAAEVMSDLYDGLANVGVCRDGAAALNKRAVDLDLGKRIWLMASKLNDPRPKLSIAIEAPHC
jgi:hypothetical protein